MIGPDAPRLARLLAEVLLAFGMAHRQPDLFGTHEAPAPPPPANGEVVAIIRARLHATLALVRSAATMPWDDHLAIIREDNAFRFGKDILPPEEGAALWAAFDVEMNRLYAEMNARLAATAAE